MFVLSCAPFAWLHCCAQHSWRDPSLRQGTPFGTAAAQQTPPVSYLFGEDAAAEV